VTEEEKVVVWTIAGGGAALSLLIILLYLRARDAARHHHGQTQRKLDVVRQDIGDVGEQVAQVSRQVDFVSQQAEGVRVQMSSDRDATKLQSEKEQGSNRRLRLNIFRHFKQWLKRIRTNGKSEH